MGACHVQSNFPPPEVRSLAHYYYYFKCTMNILVFHKRCQCTVLVQSLCNDPLIPPQDKEWSTPILIERPWTPPDN